ncbi:MAG: copper amine oxidase N-terminal domain-containing protein [Oscillospiraceae bacterium]
MKSKVKSTALLLSGVMLGVGLAGPAANAAAEFFQAQRTPHLIYVDGKQVQLETYAINGHNYVKLRDIGQAVGFEVYWDSSAAEIVSNKPYTGQPPVQTTFSTAPDHSSQEAPAVFTGYLTADVYDTIREAVVTKEATAFGSAVQGALHLRWDDKEGLKRAEEEKQQINAVLAALGLNSAIPMC